MDDDEVKAIEADEAAEASGVDIEPAEPSATGIEADGEATENLSEPSVSDGPNELETQQSDKPARPGHRSGKKGGRPGRRRWTGLIVGLCVVVAAGAGAGVWWWMARQPAPLEKKDPALAAQIAQAAADLTTARDLGQQVYDRVTGQNPSASALPVTLPSDAPSAPASSAPASTESTVSSDTVAPSDTPASPADPSQSDTPTVEWNRDLVFLTPQHAADLQAALWSADFYLGESATLLDGSQTVLGDHLDTGKVPQVVNEALVQQKLTDLTDTTAWLGRASATANLDWVQAVLDDATTAATTSQTALQTAITSAQAVLDGSAGQVLDNSLRDALQAAIAAAQTLIGNPPAQDDVTPDGVAGVWGWKDASDKAATDLGAAAQAVTDNQAAWQAQQPTKPPSTSKPKTNGSGSGSGSGNSGGSNSGGGSSSGGNSGGGGTTTTTQPTKTKTTPHLVLTDDGKTAWWISEGKVGASVVDPDKCGYDLTIGAGSVSAAWSNEVGSQDFRYTSSKLVGAGDPWAKITAHSCG